MLRGARRPLVIAGGGVHYSDARAELARVRRAVGIPVAETSAGKGAMADGGELRARRHRRDGTRAANALAREADVVLYVGTRLTDFTTGSHSLFQDPDVRFVGDQRRARATPHKLGAAAVVADASSRSARSPPR